MIWDAHAHLSFVRDESTLRTLMKDSLLDGVKGFVLGGYDADDWRMQKQIKSLFPERVKTAIGVHPWHIDKNPNAALAEWSLLSNEVHLSDFIGETGLDAVQAEKSNNMSAQEELFDRHLQVAVDVSRPVVLHVVRAHDQAIKHLKKHPSLRGFVHGFNGSPEQARCYVERGFFLSAGPGVLRPGFKGLKESLIQIPKEFWVIESDSPSQKAEPFDGGALRRVADAVGQIWKLPPDEVLRRCSSNLQTLFTFALAVWVASMA